MKKGTINFKGDKMANILKVTVPVNGYENSNYQRPNAPKTADPAIQGPITPDKVSKPDARSDSAQEQNVAMKFRYESNFENFMRQINTMPSLSQELSRFFLEMSATYAQSGLSGDFAEQIASFIEMTKLSAEELLAFMRNAGGASVRFNGAFFTLLNQAMQNSQSLEFRQSVLEFLRRYVDMAEGSHILNNIKTTLDQIGIRMFAPHKDALSELAGQMRYFGGGEGANLSTLKDGIMPLLNRYISSFHDRGDLRELVAMLASYVSRLENGGQDRVMDAFLQLMRFQSMQQTFADFDPALLFTVLQNTEFEKTGREQSWMKGLTDMIESGLASNASAETKEVLKNLMQSILLNESVYMPVLHMMLPMTVEERLTFCEMWIDPDADAKNRAETGANTVQGLVKFDIAQLGFFDLFFINKGDDLKMQIGCPEGLYDDIDTIREDIKKIVATHGYYADELFVDCTTESIPISEAFPKIFERENSINVSI